MLFYGVDFGYCSFLSVVERPRTRAAKSTPRAAKSRLKAAKSGPRAAKSGPFSKSGQEQLRAAKKAQERSKSSKHTIYCLMS